MKPFEKISSTSTPLDKINVDTDQIVPKQFLKLVTKSGFGNFLFYDWRFKDDKPISDFILNNPDCKTSQVLISGNNFGCGSSREHAVWALMDYGFKAIIASSFADIFKNNCIKNGLLPIELNVDDINWLLEKIRSIVIDLQVQSIISDDKKINFDIDLSNKKILLEGLDDISQTLRFEKKITEFEKNSLIPSFL